MFFVAFFFATPIIYGLKIKSTHFLIKLLKNTKKVNNRSNKNQKTQKINLYTAYGASGNLIIVVYFYISDRKNTVRK